MESFGYKNISRDVASNGSEDSERIAREMRLGLIDDNGKDTVTEDEQGIPLDPIAAKDQGDITKYVSQAEEAAKNPPLEEKPKADPKNKLKEKEDKAIKEAMGGGTDVLQGAIGGLAKAVQNGYNNLNIVTDYIENKIGKDDLIKASTPKATWADDTFPTPDSMAGKMAESTAQFMTLFVPGSGIIKGVTGLAKTGFVTSTVAGFAADALAFKGNEGRISDALKEIPVIGDFAIPYLLTKPDDTELDGMLKNGVEGMLLGTVGEALIAGLKFLKGSRATGKALKTAQDLESGAVKGMAETSPKGLDPAVKNIPEITPEEFKKNPSAALDTTSNPDTVKAWEERKRGVVSDSQVIENVKNSNFDLEDLMTKPRGYVYSVEEATFLAGHEKAYAEEVTKWANHPEQDDFTRAQFVIASNNARAINLMREGGKSEAGRVLRYSTVLADEISYRPDALGELTELMGREEIDRAIYAWKNTPKESKEIAIKSSYRRRFSEAAVSSFRNTLLSKPSTHLVNSASNAGFLGLNIVEREFAAKFGKGAVKEVSPMALSQAVSDLKILQNTDTSSMSALKYESHKAKIKEHQRTIQRAMNSSVEPGEAGQMLAATYDAFLDGIRGVKKTAELEGKSIIGLAADRLKQAVTQTGKEGTEKTVGKFQEGHYANPMTGKNLVPERFQSKGGNVATKTVDILGGVQNLPGKGLAWADDFWKFVGERAETKALGFRLGKKQGLQGEELAKFIQETVENPPDYIKAKADKFKKETTFTNELGPMASSLNDFLNNVDTNNPLDVHITGFFLPFRQAPVNIATQGFERTPLALMSKDYRNAIKKGGADAQVIKAKLALGTTFVGGALGMAAAGHITGGGPSDWKMRRELEQSGWRPYSLKLETDEGTKYVELVKLEPIGSMLQLSADMWEIFSERGTTDPDYGEMAIKLGLATFNLLTPEMLVDTFGNVTDALSDPKAAAKLLSRVASKTVPLAWIASDVKDMAAVAGLEPNVARDTTGYDADGTWSFMKSVTNDLRNTVPGLSRDLPAKRNIFGEEMPLLTGMGAVLSPFATTKNVANDKVFNELVDLGYNSNVAKNDLPEGEKHLVIDYPQKHIVLANGKVNLDAKQHSRYVELAGGIGLKKAPLQGKTLKEALGFIIESNYGYDSKKEVKDQVKRVKIKQIIDAYRTAAKFQMMEEFPEVKEKLDSSRKSFHNARSAVDEAEEQAGDI